jgi:hypothetical protein
MSKKKRPVEAIPEEAAEAPAEPETAAEPVESPAVVEPEAVAQPVQDMKAADEALRARLKARMDARRAVDEESLLTEDDLLDIARVKLSGGRFVYVQLPTIRQQKLLGEQVANVGVGAAADARLVELLTPFVLRYEPRIKDLIPVTPDEFEETLTLDAIYRVVLTLFPQMDPRRQLLEAGDPSAKK